MKIVRKSNFDHEDHRGNQRFVAENIEHKLEADIMCRALNDDDGINGANFYEVVKDNYVLPQPWEP